MIISIANSLHTFFLPHYMYYHFCLLWKATKHLLWKLNNNQNDGKLKDLGANKLFQTIGFKIGISKF